MTKQEKIEGIKRDIKKALEFDCSKDKCKTCKHKNEDNCEIPLITDYLIEQGYQKLPKDSVVLTKEECDNKVILNEDHFERALNYEREKARKETAKEILNRINEYNLDYNWDLKVEFIKLCKDYDVEVEE